MGPRRGPVSLRYPLQSMDRSQQDQRQDDLPFRDWDAPHRRPHAGGERLRQCRVRHHGFDRRVRRVHQARDGSAAAHEKLPGLFRRQLSHQRAPAAGDRHRDDVPCGRIHRRQHDQPGIRRNRRSRSRAHPARAHASRRTAAVLHRLVRVRQSRCARARAGRREQARPQRNVQVAAGVPEDPADRRPRAFTSRQAARCRPACRHRA